MRRRISLLFGSAVVLVGGLSVSAGAAVPAHNNPPKPGPAVVVSGLNNPRHLAWDSDGNLLIAEAGRGALKPSASNCFIGPEGQNCAGATGSVSSVHKPWFTTNAMPHRIVKGLLSAAAPDGGSATGSDGVSSQHGSVLIQETHLPTIPGVPNWQSGQLLKLRGGHLSAVASISNVELTQNPDGLQVDTDPYAVLSLGHKTSVSTDAAGNDLVLVKNGKASPFTVFPQHGCGGAPTPGCDQDSVPTSLAWGPGGKLYVGELAHFEPGEARVWKVSPSSGKLLGYYGKGGTICPNDTAGFSTITGITFGDDGSLYVSELFGGATGQGDVVKISPKCVRTSVSVPLPAGLATDHRGNLYVSAFSVSDSDGASPAPGAPALPPGQVWRVRF